MIVLPPWQFADCTTSLSGTPNAGPGVAFTPGVNNADGTPVTVLSALTHDVHYLEVYTNGVFEVTNLNDALMDILVDPAGGTSWSNFIDDLMCGAQMDMFLSTTRVYGHVYAFPIYIKSGSSIGVQVRYRDSSETNEQRVTINAYGNPSRPEMWWCGQKVESLGINAATSSGTSFLPGASGTYSSWTNIGTTTHPWGALQYSVGSCQDTNQTARGYYYQVGYGGQQVPGTPTHGFTTSASEVIGHNRPGGPVWCNIAAGTTMQIRATASGTAADSFSFAIWGVY